jgi:putative ABC transport system permease protein
MNALFTLALKYLIRYRKRYVFLFLAITFGFAVITIITSVKAGMTESLYWSAQSHYAGDVIAIGYDRDSTQIYHLGQTEIEKILKAGENIQPDFIVKRTNIMENARLYYNGVAVSQKYISGVDWQNESGYFNDLVYENPPDALEGDDIILISAPVAKKLGVHQGDSLILEILTKDGERNTGAFIVAGIIKDSSIFSYFKSYVSKAALNGLAGYGAEDCSMIGFYFADKNSIAQKQRILYEKLAEAIQVSAFITDRAVFRTEMAENWEHIRTFVLTIQVYLSEVALLLDAINLLSYFLYALMLLIIFVSALATYRLILYERTRELAVMRVIGFNEKTLNFVLIMEMICLVFISLVTGFVFACFSNKLFSLMPLETIPSFAIFTQRGKLLPIYQIHTIFINAGVVFCTFAVALGLPLFSYSRRPLVDMLSDDSI